MNDPFGYIFFVARAQGRNEDIQIQYLHTKQCHDPVGGETEHMFEFYSLALPLLLAKFLAHKFESIYLIRRRKTSQ